MKHDQGVVLGNLKYLLCLNFRIITPKHIRLDILSAVKSFLFILF
jgi:hypothetical protein